MSTEVQGRLAALSARKQFLRHLRGFHFWVKWFGTSDDTGYSSLRFHHKRIGSSNDPGEVGCPRTRGGRQLEYLKESKDREVRGLHALKPERPAKKNFLSDGTASVALVPP